MDGNAYGTEHLPGNGFRAMRRRVIDMEAPGVREEIAAAVARINASEEGAFATAEIELDAAAVWRLIPE